MTRQEIALPILASLSALSWPLAIARRAIGTAYRTTPLAANRADAASGIVGVVTALATAVMVAWLLRRRPRPLAFGLVGGLGGLVAGALLFTARESLSHPYDKGAQVFVSALGAGLGGSFFAAPVAIPVGTAFGLVVLALGKAIGVIEPPWRLEPPYLRVAVVAAILGAEATAAVALHAWGT
jgi:hypothetical protein